MKQQYPTTAYNCNNSAGVKRTTKTMFMNKLLLPLLVAFAFMVGMPVVNAQFTAGNLVVLQAAASASNTTGSLLDEIHSKNKRFGSSHQWYYRRVAQSNGVGLGVKLTCLRRKWKN